MSKFDHVTLDSKPRLAILAELRKDPRWTEWRRANSIESNDTSIGTIRAAAEAFEYDLEAAKARCFVGLNAAPSGALNATPNAMEDSRIEALIASSPSSSSSPLPSSFEGRKPDELIAELLVPASAHITPTLAAMLPSLLRPVVTIATQPARIEVKWKTQAPAGAWQPPSCDVKEWKELYKAFGMSKTAGGSSYSRIMEQGRVAICDCTEAPAIDTSYIWDGAILAQLGACDMGGLNAWAFGPAGTGKTEGVRQYAARTFRPFVRIAIDMSTTPEDLIGQYVLIKGETVWRDGKLTQAFRIPYCVVLIDEPTLLHPRALAIFQTALDTKEIRLASGELVKAEPGVFIVSADNTSGTGDETGVYKGTAPMNGAFSDRFGCYIEFTPLSSPQEAGLLANRTGIHAAAARIISDFASLTRGKAVSGELEMGLTTRRTLAWATLVMRGMGSAKAFQSSIVRIASPSDREKILALETTSLASEHARIDVLAHGAPIPPEDVPSLEELGVLEPSANGAKFDTKTY